MFIEVYRGHMITTQPVQSNNRTVSFQGLTTTYLVESEACSVLEHVLAPRTLGAPVHTHEHEDEWSYVTAGTLGVQIGDEVVVARDGDVVTKPRGIPHAFWNAGDDEVRFIEIVTPGAFAEYFADIAPLLDRPEPDVPGLMATAGRYGLAMQPETIGPLMAAHRLR